MKKTFFLLMTLCGLSASSVFAQASAKYSVIASSQPYDTLTNAINLSSGIDWDDDSFVINLPFSFQFMGKSYDSLWVETNGNLYFEGVSSLNYTVMLMGSSADLVDLGQGMTNQSPVLYKIVGNPGNRILKVEYRNAGFYDDDAKTARFNSQIWLYEQGSVVEYRYGSNSGILDYFNFFSPNPEFNCGVLSMDFFVSESKSTFLTSSTTSPDTTTWNGDFNLFDFPNLNAIAASGQVYKFMPPANATSTTPATLSAINLFPNPATSSTNLKVSLAQPSDLNISLHSLTGTSLKTWTYSNLSGANELNLDVQGLASGIYVLKCDTGTEVVSRRLVIK